MATTRVRIGKQTELSAVPYSIVRTDAANEQEYVAPGAEGTVLTVVSGIPIFQAPLGQSFNLSDGTNVQVIDNGNTLLVTSGNGITATVSATDVLTIAAKLSTDANNSITFGTDGGLYFNAPNNLTGVVWNDVTNNLEFTYDINGTPTTVNVNIADTVSSWLADFTISDGTTTDVVNNHETLVFAGTDGLTPTVSPNQVSYGLRTQEDIFTGLTTGSTVTLTQTPLKIFTVSRNGLDQLLGATNDYTISGTTVTFNVAFGISGGAQGAEQVRVFYTY